MVSIRRKKSSKPARSKSRAASPAPAAPLGPPPQSTDPKAQAKYFMELLGALAQQGTPEATRIRQALIDAVTAFDRAEDEEQAKQVLLMHLAGIELGVSKILLATTQKMRDRFVKESRRLGTKTPQAKTVRLTAEAFDTLCLGFSKMIEASERQDLEGRAAAYKILEEAGEKMKALESASR